jgi:hypothetical protein
VCVCVCEREIVGTHGKGDVIVQHGAQLVRDALKRIEKARGDGATQRRLQPRRRRVHRPYQLPK